MKLFAFADEASSMIDGQILAMQRNGLDGLEIRGVDGVNIADITEEKALEVRKKLDTAGLSVYTIGSPIGKIHIENDDFKEHLQKFRHTLKLAKILGAENIRLFSFYLPEGCDPETYREEVIHRLREFVSIAEGSGVALCHENEKGIYGDTAERCLTLFKAVPELKGIFDPANFIQCGVDTLKAWELLAPYTKYLHIKDAAANGSVVPAGRGEGHVPEILHAFQAQGGTHLTIEPHLAVFDGLKALEQSGNVTKLSDYTYPDNDAAFDAACDALKVLL